VRVLTARLRFLAELVAALLFVVMFAAFLLQVFTRYVLNDPIAWTQEFVLLAYIWIVFWCGAFLLREKDHIAFDMLSTALPMRARRILSTTSPSWRSSGRRSCASATTGSTPSSGCSWSG
jgi:TRAP-type C4-dicarboxylate transport system permease small subunit